MSNRRRPRPGAQPAALIAAADQAVAGISELAAAGGRLPGGCHDCTAHQTITEPKPRVFVVTVHHDPTCPALRGVTPR